MNFKSYEFIEDFPKESSDESFIKFFIFPARKEKKNCYFSLSLGANENFENCGC